MRKLGLFWIVLAAACGGRLSLFESEFGAGGPDPTELPCTVINPVGQCPDGLQCCNGVCASDCSEWACECDPSNEACVDGECLEITSENECTPTHPDGLCPVGSACIAGTCIPISGPCGCDPELACVDGECVEITEDKACSADNLDGLCPDGQLCIGGQCVPLDNVCSPDNPSGLCPPGASCVGGRCLPTGERPCGPGALDGRCPNCQHCVAPGVCETLFCSATAPHCACPTADEYCNQGLCECLPCSEQYPAGCCPTGDFCSAAGVCVVEGGCAHADDCTAPGTICSLCAGQCINDGTCVCDDDCDQYFTCDTNTSTCVREVLCPNGDVDCPDDEYCDSTGHCRPDGTCGSDDDCTVAGQYCSSCHECIDVGACCADDDCGATQFCSSANTCLDDGKCATTIDCPPGNVCNAPDCEPSGDPCSTNGPASCVEAGGETFWCCPTGNPEDCCEQGERCSVDNICIPDGRCVDSSDCYEPWFECVDFVCAAVTPCVGSGCAPGQTCSAAGGCIPDDGRCADDGDCPAGEVCNSVFACEPAVDCGNQRFEATLIPPNMLIVLDRSGSMAYCLDVGGADDSRWNVARDAVEQVVNTNSEQIRFGLSTYPFYCPGSNVCGIAACDDSCTNSCDWDSVCGNASQTVCEQYPPCVWTGSDCVPKDSGIATGNNGVPGDIDVPVGDDAPGVVAALAPPVTSGPQHPGGYTPTGRTLRNIAAQLDAFGLAYSAACSGIVDQPTCLSEPGCSWTSDTCAPTDRDNFIMLVTDGAANTDGGTYGVCDGNIVVGDDTIARINCTLDYLRTQDPPVLTFPVGFIGESRDDMNCHAVHGGTSRCATPADCLAISVQADCENRLGCSWSGSCAGGVDDQNCDSLPTGQECFYRANSAQELNDAFATIAGQIASCNYALDQTPPDADRLYVYFYHRCADAVTEISCNDTPGCTWENGSCVGEPLRIPRDRSRLDNWDYDPVTNQILFAGAACDTVKTGQITPVVILGCCTGEGC